jgi:small subunit ribosomal protein S7
MSRKGINKIRKVLPDTIYGNITVNKIINACMRDGKKIAAEKQVYSALESVKKEFPKEEILEVLDRALENIRPKIEVKPRRIGGSVYQVPTPVRGVRQDSLAIRWLIAAARAKSNKQFHTFAEKLVSELLATLNNEGSAVGKRIEIEKMAEANKAFAHLRW